MKINSSSPVSVPDPRISGLQPEPGPGTMTEESQIRTDPVLDASNGATGRAMDHDIDALNVKTKIGAPGAPVATGSGILLSSKTSAPPSGPPAPQVMRDFPNEIEHFLRDTLPKAFDKFDAAMKEAALVINGDLTPAEYARASNGGRSVESLLKQVQDARTQAEQLLKAGRELKADTAAAEGLHRGWRASDNLDFDVMRGLERKLAELKQTEAALQAMTHGGGGWSGGAAAVGKLRPGPGIKTVEGATEAMGEAATKAMGEGVSEAFVEGAAKGLAAGGGRALLGALAEIGLPLLDAFLVGVAGLQAMEEGKEQLKNRNISEGFASGLAAGLLEKSPDWVRDKLAFHSTSPEITDRVAGTEGLAEKSFNEGLRAGYAFARSLTPAQKAQWRQAAFHALQAQGYHVNNEQDLFSEANVRKTGAALIPILKKVVAAEQAREDEAAKAAIQRPPREYYGHNM